MKQLLPTDWCEECDSAIDEHEEWCSEGMAQDPPEEENPLAVMDYPTAWEFVRKTSPDAHHPKCSYRVTIGAILCDCDVLNNEYERRKGGKP